MPRRKVLFPDRRRMASSRGAAVRFRSNRFLYRDERRGNDLSYFSAVVRMGGFEIYPVFNRAFFRDKAEIRSVFCKKTYRYEELSALKIWRGVTRASLSVRYASNLEKIKIYDKSGKVVFKANEDYLGYEEMKVFLRKKGIAIDDKEQKKTEKRNKKKKKKRLENARAEWLEKHPAGNGAEWSDKNRKK